MATRPPLFRSGHARSPKEAEREADVYRGSARRRGYDGRWEKARLSFLREHPVCEYCDAGAFGERPRVTEASLVDHLYPHRGDKVLFWISALWVACCRACHDGPKRSIEHQGERFLDGLARRLGRPTKREVHT